LNTRTNTATAIDERAWQSDCAAAMQLQLAGRLDRAEQAYRAILQQEPAHAMSNHCLGMLLIQRRRPADALPFLLTALNATPQVPDYWLGYLEALLQARRLDTAEDTLALGRQHGLAGHAVEAFTLRLDATREGVAP